MTTEVKLHLVIGAIMSFAMSALLSGFFTFLQLGLGPAWLAAWAFGFAVGWPLAFVLALVIGRPARALAMRLVQGSRF